MFIHSVFFFYIAGKSFQKGKLNESIIKIINCQNIAWNTFV